MQNTWNPNGQRNAHAFRHWWSQPEAPASPRYQTLHNHKGSSYSRKGWGRERSLQMEARVQMRGKHSRTRQFTGRLHLSSCWILLLQQGRWLCKPHGKDYQNNHKDHDHQNNLYVEDSQDERAKGRQSSFLKVLTILNNSHFFSLSFLKRDCKY